MARKQRQFTIEFKLETVTETVRGEKPITLIMLTFPMPSAKSRIG